MCFEKHLLKKFFFKIETRKKMKDYSFARLAALASEVGNTLQRKNIQYGDSFQKTPKILEILYPDGVKPNQYRNLLTLVRMLDKINRISASGQGGKHIRDDEDPWTDLAGYAILAQTIQEEDKRERLAMAKACDDAKNRIYRECDHVLDIENTNKKA